MSGSETADSIRRSTSDPPSDLPPMRPLAFSSIEGWEEDDHAAPFAAFLTSARRIGETPPKTRPLGGDADALARIAHLALASGELSREAARKFFEAHFVPWDIEGAGFVTGYYEPEIEASRAPTDRFAAPFYRRPADLIDITEENRPPDWDRNVRFGRLTEGGVVEFHDRSAIENGALQGRNLELAFCRSPVAAFFVHVQGSARLRLSDGSTMRIAYDGKSGHPYTSIGRLAVERGLLKREEAHKEGLEAWLNANPEAGRALMRENRSFIFFRETRQAEGDGPLGASGVPLAAGRSLAVDRLLVTFHTPVWVAADGLADPDQAERPFRRLMIAQDTGSAIVGPGRGDIFFGSGDRAGSLASNVRHKARMILLLPKAVGLP